MLWNDDLDEFLEKLEEVEEKEKTEQAEAVTGKAGKGKKKTFKQETMASPHGIRVAVKVSFKLWTLFEFYCPFFLKNMMRKIKQPLKKGNFYSESAMRFSNLQSNYSKSISWAWNLNKLFCFGREIWISSDLE